MVLEALFDIWQAIFKKVLEIWLGYLQLSQKSENILWYFGIHIVVV